LSCRSLEVTVLSEFPHGFKESQLIVVGQEIVTRVDDDFAGDVIKDDGRKKSKGTDVSVVKFS
jgi:hypothetical protein